MAKRKKLTTEIHTTIQITDMIEHLSNDSKDALNATILCAFIALVYGVIANFLPMMDGWIIIALGITWLAAGFQFFVLHLAIEKKIHAELSRQEWIARQDRKQAKGCIVE